MREWSLRKDGCSNTITTVTKDNYIFETVLPNICINDKGKINKPPQITYGYAPTLVAEFHGNLPKVVVSAAMRGRYNEAGNVEQHIETRLDEVANAITTVSKDSMVIEVDEGDE